MVLVHFGLFSSGQKWVKLQSDINDRHFNKVYKLSDAPDSLQLIRELHRRGYLLSRIQTDSVSDTLLYIITAGTPYTWAQIHFRPADSEVLSKAGVKLRKLNGRNVDPDHLNSITEKILRYYENHGYPFASVYLDSCAEYQNSISCMLISEPGPLVHFDSVIIKGDLKIRKSFITRYLGMQEGAVYNEGAIRQSSNSLRELNFVSEVRPAYVSFTNNLTKVYLYLNNKPASRFDGIVGFLPDAQTGEIVVTGDVSLQLENALKQGETIALNWRRLQTRTQDLQTEAVLPFVLNTSFSPDFVMKIYRRDTLFTDVFLQGGLRYGIGRNNFIRIFADRQTTSLNSTAPYRNTSVTPQFLDRAVNSYGLGLRYQKVDYRLNPSRGIEVMTEGAAGNKTILKNPAIPAEIYERLNLVSLQLKATINTAWYVPMSSRIVWHQRVLAAYLGNDQIFNNEAFRIGGLKTLRGFDEESIFATGYVIARNELRYKFEANGYVFLLADVAWYENKSLNHLGVRRDVPSSFGVGLSFSTPAGIFSLSTAVGSQQGNPYLLRSSKVHFGYLSLF
ncbi:MAG: membrane protein [Salibacteraceae bacterium]